MGRAVRVRFLYVVTEVVGYDENESRRGEEDEDDGEGEPGEALLQKR